MIQVIGSNGVVYGQGSIQIIGSDGKPKVNPIPFSGTMDDIPNGIIYVKTENNFTDAQETKLAAITGTNTGDETNATIKTKLGISTLSGSNTGDQDLSPYLTSSTASVTYQPLGTYATGGGSASGVNTTDETTATIGTLINGSTTATPTDTDLVAVSIGSTLKKVTWSNIKGFFKTYFDTLYQTIGSFVPTTRSITINGTTQDLSADITFTVSATDPAGWTTIVKSANQDVTNSATLVTDTSLQFSVVAGGHYMIECELVVSGSSTTGDYQSGFSASVGTITGKGTCQNLTSTNAIQNIIITAAGTAATTSIVTGAPTANINDLVAIKMIYAFTASANAVLRYQFANGTAGTGNISRTWKGSILKYKRLD